MLRHGRVFAVFCLLFSFKSGNYCKEFANDEQCKHYDNLQMIKKNGGCDIEL